MALTAPITGARSRAPKIDVNNLSDVADAVILLLSQAEGIVDVLGDVLHDHVSDAELNALSASGALMRSAIDTLHKNYAAFSRSAGNAAR